MEQKFMDVNECAAYLGYNPYSLRNLVWKDKIPHYKPAGKLLFKITEIDEWIEKGGNNEAKNTI